MVMKREVLKLGLIGVRSTRELKYEDVFIRILEGRFSKADVEEGEEVNMTRDEINFNVSLGYVMYYLSNAVIHMDSCMFKFRLKMSKYDKEVFDKHLQVVLDDISKKYGYSNMKVSTKYKGIDFNMFMMYICKMGFKYVNKNKDIKEKIDEMEVGVISDERLLIMSFAYFFTAFLDSMKISKSNRVYLYNELWVIKYIHNEFRLPEKNFGLSIGENQRNNEFYRYRIALDNVRVCFNFFFSYKGVVRIIDRNSVIFVGIFDKINDGFDGQIIRLKPERDEDGNIIKVS